MNALTKIEERTPPHNEEAEQALLGAILLNNAAIEEADLSPEHFYVPVHGRIFDACRDVIASGKVADNITLRSAFDGDSGLSESGGASYLARLLTSAPSPRAVRHYAATIRDCWLRRELIYRAEDAIEAAYNEPNGEDQADALESGLFALRQDIARGESVSAATAFDAMVSQAQSIASGETQLVDTGLRELDRILGGLAGGDLTIIGARPGMGKTSLAQSIARYNARRDQSVGVLQLEMPAEQMIAREVSSIVGIPSRPILYGTLNQAEWGRVVQARAEIARLPLHIDARPGLHLDQLLPRARRMVRRHGIRLLVIDYLGLVRFTARSRYEGLTDVSQRLKEMARTLGIPVICLHQLSRAPEGRENKRPTLADLRDTGAIEQDADNVLFIHREDYYLARDEPDRDLDYEAHLEWENKMGRARGQAEIIVAKQRNGETGTARCLFDGRTTTFKDG